MVTHPISASGCLPHNHEETHTARKSKSKSGSGKWTDGLDPQDVEEALEEATVDAYDEYEQHTGLLTMVQDQVVFPFRAWVLGDEG